MHHKIRELFLNFCLEYSAARTSVEQPTCTFRTAFPKVSAIYPCTVRVCLPKVCKRVTHNLRMIVRVQNRTPLGNHDGQYVN